MNINLTMTAHYLLMHVLTYSGEKEIGADGKETNSYLRLNNEETSQRRHYYKKVMSVLNERQKQVKEMIDASIEVWKKINVKEEKEDVAAYDLRIDAFIKSNNNLQKTVSDIKTAPFEIDITDKTKEVIKKYFVKFGDVAGWTLGDSDVVEEIKTTFSIAPEADKA